MKPDRHGIQTLLLIILFGVGLTEFVAGQTGKPPASNNPAATQQYNAAVGLQKNEIFDTAAEEWAAFLTKFPNDPLAEWAQHNLGVCLFKSKQYEKAIAAFDKVIKTYPKFESLEASYLYLGLTHYSLGQSGKAGAYDQAIAAFASLTSKFPKGQFIPDALYYQGESYFALKKLPEAVNSYALLAKSHPQSPLAADALYAQGFAQQSLQQAAAAEATYAAFLSRFPKHKLAPEVTMRRGESLMAQQKFSEAEQLFAAAAATPNFEYADLSQIQQADCLSNRKQYAEAAAIYSSVSQKFPNSKLLGRALAAAGKCFYLSGKYAEARVALNKVLAAAGDDAPEAAHWIARSWLKENQAAEALKVVESSLPKAAQSSFAPQLMLDKADALYEIPSRRAEAAKAYADVSTRFPQDSAAGQSLYNAAYTSLGLGDYPSALGYTATFIKSYPQHELIPEVRYVAAESQLLLNQYDKAEPSYQQLLASYPQHADAGQWRLRMGLSQYLQKKYAAAIITLQAAASSLKSKSLQAEAYYLLGGSQFELKQYDAAAKALEASLKADETWRQADEAMLVLGNAQRQLNKLPEAIATTRNMIEKFPNSKFLDRAHYRLGEYAYHAGDYKTAASEYALVSEKWPTSELAAHAANGQGWSLLGQGDAAGAVKAFSTLVDRFKNDPLVPRGKYGRARAYHQLKDYAAAVSDLMAFLQTEITPTERSDARFVLGLCQAGLKKNAEATATFQILLADDPQYAAADQAWYELAWTLDAQEKKAESAETFSKLAEKFPNSALAVDSLFRVGEYQYEQGDFTKASVAYYSAMTKGGKSELAEKAAHKLGWSYYRQDDFAKAQQQFAYQRATFPAGPLAADAAFMEAESLFKQEKFGEALAVYELVKNPSSPDFMVLALLHGGQCAGQLKQWQKSLAMLEQCAKQFPQTDYLPEVLYEQGWARQNLGKPDEALPLYEAATANTNREVAARARFMIGEIYFEKKDHKEAVRHFFRVAYGYSFPEWQANALYEAARCLEVLDKLDQAKKSYLEVVEKHPTSDKAALSKKRLAELGG